MNETIELIADAALAGITVTFAGNDRLSVTGDLSKTDIIEKLRARKPAILEYFRMKHTVLFATMDDLFVSKKLRDIRLPSPWVRGVDSVWVGDEPYWRLSPSVAVWFRHAIDKLFLSGRSVPQAASEKMREYRDYVYDRYFPHEIRIAEKLPIPRDLPKPVSLPF